MLSTRLFDYNNLELRLNGSSAVHLGIFMPPQSRVRYKLVSDHLKKFLLFVSELEQLLCTPHSSRTGI